MPGFPDWQQIVQWVGTALFGFSGVVLGGGGTVNVLSNVQTSSFRGVLIYATAPAHGVWLQVTPTFVGPLGQAGFPQLIYLPANTALVAVFDVIGNEVSVDFVNGTPGDSPFIGVFPTNLPPGCYPPAIGSVLLNQNPSAVIGGGGTSTIFLNPYFGRATLVVANGSAQPFTIFCTTQDTAAVEKVVAFWVAVAAGAFLTQDVSIPMGQNIVSIHNAGAANAQIDAYIAGHMSTAPAA